MPDIRYVCLSDMHLGAQNSLLTNLGADAVTPEPLQASPPLKALVDCLAALIGHNEQPSIKPELILNGDILELAVASDEIAVMAFERFVQLALDEHDLFDRTIHYLPGNHDHHLWETARERQYAEYIARHEAGSPVEPPWHATHLFPAYDQDQRQKRRVEAELLNAVVRRFPRLHDVTVEVHYPTFGLRSREGGVVAFHHGHYAESIYRLMSRLKVALFPGSQTGPEAWDWEAENFAWIDFFWSTLGRSGTWGADVGLLYDMLQDERALQAVGRNLADSLSAMKSRTVPRFARRWTARAVIRHIANRVGSLERSRSADSRPQLDSPVQLTPAGIRGLSELVEGPLAQQIAADCGGVPEQVSFVFGHTHKPYETRCAYAGYPRAVDVYNTGGWVVDTLQPEVQQGAAAVLIDENLHVATLRIYNQQRNHDSTPVRISAPTASPFLDRIRSLVHPDEEPWAGLSRAVSVAAPQRSAGLQAIIESGIANARSRSST
jgi:hypothetical protein